MMKKLVCVAIFLFPALVLADHGHGGAAVSPGDALKRLQDGNARFVANKAEHPHDKTDRAKETAEHGQHPFATILACSDSRVPLEVIFDHGIGDIFAIKVAGNVSGASQLGSIEYGVEHTGTALVVVLGHTQCGAITAACTDGGHEGNIESLMQAIKPAVKQTERATGKSGKDIIPETVRANVWEQVKALFVGSEILREAVKANKALVVGAVYDISTGEVQFLGEHPQTPELLLLTKPKPASSAREARPVRPCSFRAFRERALPVGQGQ
jgi:carbonic anhydrase